VRRLVAFGAIFGIVVAAMACGGGDDNGLPDGNDPRNAFLSEVEALVRQQIEYMESAIDAESLTADDAELRAVLPTMVLQSDDIPDEMQPLGSSFSTNEQASGGLGSGPTKAQLDEWGRILGYSISFQRTAPTAEANLTGVTTTISVYEAAEGTADSFNDRVALARSADWQASHIDLEEFEQVELSPDLPVDDLFWLHLTGYQPIGPGERLLVADDQIVFRVGRTWGFIGAVSSLP
jgi:hypothetical protein